MGIYYLSEQNSVWGDKTGYTRLSHYMRQQEPETHHFHIRNSGKLVNFLGRFIGNQSMRPPKRNYRNLYEWYFYYFYTRRLRPGSVYHLINFDGMYPFLARLDEVPRRLIFTLHDPNVLGLTDEKKFYLAQIKSAIVLYRRDIEWFESFVGKGRVKFVHYGVDTDYFHPNEMVSIPEQPRLLFVGRIYRDTAMLARVIQSLTRMLPHVRFDLVVSAVQRATDTHIQSISHLPTVTLHTAISDAKLRILYQQSYLLLLPLIDSGANTAIVEALACGLPIVTNDVGGVVDYGGGTIYPTVAKGDVQAMIALIEKYLNDFKWRNDVAAAGRDFAVSYLAWPVVAKKHHEVYEALCL